MWLARWLLLAAVAGAAGERPQRWREVGFNPVLDVDPAKRIHARMVANEEMAFLWGGTKGGVRPLPPDICSRQRMRSTNLHPRPATSARARTRTSM
jgi:hypothetical protein